MVAGDSRHRGSCMRQLYTIAVVCDQEREVAFYRGFFGGPVLTIASYSGKVGSSFRDTGET